jgi:hypothetical protein
MADLFRVALTPSAAIQATRAAQSGLRMAMTENVGAGVRAMAVHSDAKPATAKAG